MYGKSTSNKNKTEFLINFPPADKTKKKTVCSVWVTLILCATAMQVVDTNEQQQQNNNKQKQRRKVSTGGQIDGRQHLYTPTHIHKHEHEQARTEEKREAFHNTPDFLLPPGEDIYKV